MARTARGRMRRVGAVLAIGMLGTACGSISNPIAGLTTARAVGQSFANLFHQPGVTVQLSLDATPSQLQQLLQSSGGSKVPDGVLAAIPSTSISYGVLTRSGEPLSALFSGQQLSASAGSALGATEIALHLGGDTPAELRALGSILYARLDIDTLVRDFGFSPTVPTSFRHGLARAAEEAPGIGALGAGRWVSANLSPLITLLPKTPTPQITKSQLVNLFAALRAALTDNATFTNSGTHSGRTEYTISIGVEGAVRRALAGVEGLLPATLQSELQGLNTKADAIPSTLRATFEEWVRGDKAEEIDFNVLQFDHSTTAPVYLELVLGPPPQVSAPSGAVPVDLSKIGTILHGLSSAGALGRSGLLNGVGGSSIYSSATAVTTSS